MDVRGYFLVCKFLFQSEHREGFGNKGCDLMCEDDADLHWEMAFPDAHEPELNRPIKYDMHQNRIHIIHQRASTY